MRMQATAHIKADACRKAWCLAGVLVVALLLAGCDSCGNWVSPMSQACRQQAPHPQ